MPISDYSTNRDANAEIPPGDIRAESFATQQIVNSIRQIMADIAGYVGTDVQDIIDAIDALQIDVAALEAWVASPPQASTTQSGMIEIATNAETGGQAGGTDTTRAVTPDDLSFHSGKKETRLLTITATNTTNVLDIGTNWKMIEMAWALTPSADSDVGFQISYDNGSTWQNTAASHNNFILFQDCSGAPTTPAAASGTTAYFGMAFNNTMQDAASTGYGYKGYGLLTRDPNPKALSLTSLDYNMSYVNSNPSLINAKGISYITSGTNVLNALRILAITGASTLTGWVKIEIYY